MLSREPRRWIHGDPLAEVLRQLLVQRGDQLVTQLLVELITQHAEHDRRRGDDQTTEAVLLRTRAQLLDQLASEALAGAVAEINPGGRRLRARAEAWRLLHLRPVLLPVPVPVPSHHHCRG